MKTKKWVEAKKNAYDGDDWGDYDEYDEYGAEEPPPPPQPAAPPGPRGFGQRFDQPSRSFTDPQRQAQPQPGRRNSFEAGDEHRAFSASMGPPPQEYAQRQQGMQGQPPAPVHPALRQASGAESDISDTPQHRRDFSPSALPPPLHTRISPGPGSATGSPSNTQFPPRKSSIGQVESPSAMSPRERASSNPGKSLPFIRPADIYKRVEEERQRERASIDSSRPSLDSLTSRPRDDFTSLQGVQEQPGSDNLGTSGDAGKSLQPLETVAERKSEYLPDFSVGTQDPGKPSTQPPSSLPPIEGISAFNNDFWSSGPQPHSQFPAPTDRHTPLASPPDDQGFRGVVDQAFNRSDDQRSVPPTPISKTDSSVSRSNTGSTSGISPIMSRVPSSATSALKARNQAGGDGSTPVIAEEAGETSTPVSRPTSAAMLGGGHQVPRKPSPSGVRNLSYSSLPGSGLATPSPGESPARSPAIEPHSHAPEPESAQLSMLSPTSPDPMAGGADGMFSTSASREADIASAMKKSPDNAAPELSAAQRQSQQEFLDSHKAQSPIADAVPRSRSESPNKGRVQELAGKFGDVSNSRRGSTQSTTSRNSAESWERSQDNSRASSPTKAGGPANLALSSRPAAGREASFRPKLPGQWESYATTAGTPSEQDKEFTGGDKGTTFEPNVSSPLQDADLTPTTTKHPVSTVDPSQPAFDPLSALKAAGAAVGEALQASVGSQPSQGEDASREYSHGDVLPRPLQLDRKESSVSTIPPTPPAKDTPESEYPPPPPPLKEKSPEPQSPSTPRATTERPTFVPKLSTDPAADDEESDRLRKEIVASLSPRTSEVPTAEQNRSSLQPGGPPVGRESSIFPSEYDSYWADRDRTSPRPSQDLNQNAPEHGRQGAEHSPEVPKSTSQPSTEPPHPSLLTRFSWENRAPQVGSPDHQAQAGATAQAPQKAENQERLPSPPVEQAATENREESFEGIPDQYFGPAHSVVVSRPDPISDADLATHAPTPPPDSAKPVSSPTQPEGIRESSPTSGLHVVNSDLNPEAVDLPPRLSREVSPISPEPLSNIDSPAVGQQDKAPELEPASTQVAEPTPGTAAQDYAPKSPSSDKPLGFRDIVNMKTPSERIATYNKTREYWAHADHGLSDWVASTVNANPDLATQSYPPPRPALTSTGTTRHKPTGSLSLFSKHQTESGSPSSSQAPATPISGPHGGGGRSASHQMQAKGKDLLHTAGVLGGKGMSKGMTGAKGLFAKGKSRFKSDKVDK